MIRSPGDLANMVQQNGFLPLLKNSVPGFSVEEHTPPGLWFAADTEGPWEWKGPVIRQTGCAYGKFFEGRAGFISALWFIEFANCRRDGYDLDARYEDGLIRRQDRDVYQILSQHPSLLSKEWRKRSGIRKRGEFDAIVSRLQRMGYVTTIDFVYEKDRFGRPYGWGVARYATPENYWGGAFCDQVYCNTPAESKAKILTFLSKRGLADPEKAFRQIIGDEK